MPTPIVTRFEHTVNRLTFQHRQTSHVFDSSELHEQFIRYYNERDTRIAVLIGTEIWIGTIGMTTGWKPCFLLMPTAASTGSVNTLHAADTIIATKRMGDRHFFDPNTGKRVKFKRSPDTSYGAWVEDES